MAANLGSDPIHYCCLALVQLANGKKKKPFYKQENYFMDHDQNSVHFC